MTNFSDKTVIVTGAGAGIGFELCSAFAQQGASVALNDIDGALAQGAAERINKNVGAKRVFPYTLDVADIPALEKMVKQFSNRFKRLDVMIANAGISDYGPFLEYTPNRFDRLTQVNLRGAYFSAQFAAKAMIKHNIPGRIILMSSITGSRAHLNLSAYGTTKAGITMMAKALALELGQYGITVNGIKPGATLTERTRQLDPNYDQNWASVTPTGRAGTVQDIASAVLFLCSPQASQITGQDFIIDGGWSLQSPLPAGHLDD